MGPGTHSGAKGAQGGKKVPKMIWIWSGLEPFLAPFWHFEAPLWRSFFDVFFEGLFFASWATFGRPGCPKGSQNEPKWSQTGSRRHLVGSARTMVFTVQEAYGEVSGRLRETTFSRLRLQTLPGGVLGIIFSEFRRFGVPFGAPWGSILDSKWRPFSGSEF